MWWLFKAEIPQDVMRWAKWRFKRLSVAIVYRADKRHHMRKDHSSGDTLLLFDCEFFDCRM